MPNFLKFTRFVNKALHNRAQLSYLYSSTNLGSNDYLKLFDHCFKTTKYSSFLSLDHLSFRRFHGSTSLRNSGSENSGDSLDLNLYTKISEETLEALSDHFDERSPHDADISYADGVLTVKLGDKYGTYVINKQVPNKQIWLSSPISGPKRYDYKNDGWYYKYDSKSLHALLDEELSKIFPDGTEFHKCSYGTDLQKQD